MAIQGAINRLIGTAGAAAALSEKLGKEKGATPESKDSGVDAKMAAKARRVVQQKIKTINANKELSAKARTRRIGKAIDEYHNALGGNK